MARDVPWPLAVPGPVTGRAPQAARGPCRRWSGAQARRQRRGRPRHLHRGAARLGSRCRRSLRQATVRGGLSLAFTSWAASNLSSSPDAHDPRARDVVVNAPHVAAKNEEGVGQIKDRNDRGVHAGVELRKVKHPEHRARERERKLRPGAKDHTPNEPYPTSSPRDDAGTDSLLPEALAAPRDKGPLNGRRQEEA